LPITLKAPKPKPNRYPKEINTLGDHIRARRIDLELFQSEVARQIGVTASMLVMWETNQHAIGVRYIPQIIEFLGYVPYRTPKSFGDWLKMVRSCQGLSQRGLAKLIGGDQRSVVEWEAGLRAATDRSIAKLRTVLKPQQ
jgi:DNA-binding transcriptional regulator YiaG